MTPLRLLIVALASSYVTLGVFAPRTAAALWAPYAIVMFVLAVGNLVVERRRYA
jgi:hypothetical protein